MTWRPKSARRHDASAAEARHGQITSASQPRRHCAAAGRLRPRHAAASDDIRNIARRARYTMTCLCISAAPPQVAKMSFVADFYLLAYSKAPRRLTPCRRFYFHGEADFTGRFATPGAMPRRRVSRRVGYFFSRRCAAAAFISAAFSQKALRRRRRILSASPYFAQPADMARHAMRGDIEYDDAFLASRHQHCTFRRPTFKIVATRYYFLGSLLLIFAA